MGPMDQQRCVTCGKLARRGMGRCRPCARQVSAPREPRDRTGLVGGPGVRSGDRASCAACGKIARDGRGLCRPCSNRVDQKKEEQRKLGEAALRATRSQGRKNARKAATAKKTAAAKKVPKPPTACVACGSTARQGERHCKPCGQRVKRLAQPLRPGGWVPGSGGTIIAEVLADPVNSRSNKASTWRR